MLTNANLSNAEKVENLIKPDFYGPPTRLTFVDIQQPADLDPVALAFGPAVAAIMRRRR